MTINTRISAVVGHLIILLFFFAPSSYAAWNGSPDVLLTFESNSLGSNAAGKIDSFKFAYSGTKITDTRSQQGSKAAEAAWNSGTIQEGGWWEPSKHLVEGDEVWVRYNVYFQSDFDFTTSSGPGIKFLRLHSVTSSGAHVGYVDVYIGSGGTISLGNEPDPDGLWHDYGPWPKTPENIAKFPLGKWATIEQYVKIGTAGNSIYRVWIDDKLVGESTSLATVRPGGHIQSGGIFTQINGGSAKVQKAWIDNIAVVYSPNTPPNTDLDGNRFISSALNDTLSRPNPPTLD